MALFVGILLIFDAGDSSEQSRVSQRRASNGPILTDDEAKKYMLELVNEERDKAGVPSVKLGNNMASQLHAEAAINNCYSSHWDRWGLKPNHRYTLAGGTGLTARMFQDTTCVQVPATATALSTACRGKSETQSTA